MTQAIRLLPCGTEGLGGDSVHTDWLLVKFLPSAWYLFIYLFLGMVSDMDGGIFFFNVLESCEYFY